MKRGYRYSLRLRHQSQPRSREVVGKSPQPCPSPPAGVQAARGSRRIPLVVWVVAVCRGDGTCDIRCDAFSWYARIVLRWFVGRFFPQSSSPTGGPVAEYCTYVVKDPVGVYSAPDIGAKRIKLKDLGERIRISPRPHPPGWIAVRTPQDYPGYNWMPTTGLAPITPC